jgi:hypothetical protein
LARRSLAEAYRAAAAHAGELLASKRVSTG